MHSAHNIAYCTKMLMQFAFLRPWAIVQHLLSLSVINLPPIKSFGTTDH